MNLLVDTFSDTIRGSFCPCPRSDDMLKIGNSIDDIHCFDCSLVASNRISRHNSIYNELSRLILKNIPLSCVEPEYLIRYQNTCDKKADLKITLPNGDVFFLDITICNSGAKSYQNMDIDALLKLKEKNKISQYNCVGFNENTKNFVPFVLDVSGVFGNRAVEFINYLHNLDSNISDRFRTMVLQNLNVVLASGLAKTVYSFNCGMSNSISAVD